MFYTNPLKFYFYFSYWTFLLDHSFSFIISLQYRFDEPVDSFNADRLWILLLLFVWSSSHRLRINWTRAGWLLRNAAPRLYRYIFMITSVQSSKNLNSSIGKQSRSWWRFLHRTIGVKLIKGAAYRGITTQLRHCNNFKWTKLIRVVWWGYLDQGCQ